MSRPSITVVEPRDLGERNWGVETLLIETEKWIGKRLDMIAGTAGNLQYHRWKEEAFHLHSGKATVEYDKDGSLVKLEMLPGMTVHVPPGAPHRVTAITDCVFYEWSNPVYSDRVRCEADYHEPEADGLPSTS